MKLVQLKELKGLLKANFKYYQPEEYFKYENIPGLKGKIATHHLKLFHLIESIEKPIVVECGTGKGQSTCLLLSACEKQKGKMLSLDIQNCSDVADSASWTFLQIDDRKADYIVSTVPYMQDGINLLHIDSLHTGAHVITLLMNWFPYIKKGGYITFHDIDPRPYKSGQRKSNPKVYADHCGLTQAIKEFFYANEDKLFLEYHFGSTGMGIMRKLSPLHSVPHKPNIETQWEGSDNLDAITALKLSCTITKRRLSSIISSGFVSNLRRVFRKK